jgi:RES domain
MGHPGPHPDPPSDLRLRKLPIVEFGDVLHRTHRRDRTAVFFGRSGRNRFDDPQNEYGVLYAARDPYGAFIETFGQSTGNASISTAGLARYSLARLAAQRPLRLLDITASGSLARIGADGRLFAGEHSVAQSWSRALYEHPYAAIDGILYPARHDPNCSAMAIFDRAPQIDVLDSIPWHDGGVLRPLLAEILNHYAFSLIETVMTPERKRPGQATQMTQRGLFD